MTDTAALRDRVVQIARTWKGTPAIYGQCVKGVAVDCGRFIASVLQEAGIIDVDIAGLPQLPPLWFMHHAGETEFCRWRGISIRSYLDIIRVFAVEYELQPGQKPQPGDIIVSRFHRDYAHTALVTAWPGVILAACESCVGELPDVLSNSQLRFVGMRFFDPFHK
jgi:hypothetical protein